MNVDAVVTDAVYWVGPLSLFLALAIARLARRYENDE